MAISMGNEFNVQFINRETGEVEFQTQSMSISDVVVRHRPEPTPHRWSVGMESISGSLELESWSQEEVEELTASVQEETNYETLLSNLNIVGMSLEDKMFLQEIELEMAKLDRRYNIDKGFKSVNMKKPTKNSTAARLLKQNPDEL